MKTKIVYVIISSADDIYFEQVWASAWSLMHFNPSARITLLTDEATSKSLYADARRASLELFDEVKTVTFDREYSNKEKSRWIKTNMRQLVEGDFLFIDADTIICGDLSEIDQLTCSVGAVLDYNCHSREIADYFIFRDMYTNRLKRVFGVDYTPDVDVYNSGVMYVRDDDRAREFFQRWHENWLVSLRAGYVVDQLPLVKTCMDLHQPIVELPGIYDCQVRFSIQYLMDAKIVHTFATQDSSALSPILDTRMYEEIKQNHGLTDSVKDLLLHCKQTFASPSILLDKTWIKLRFQPANLYVQSYMNSPKAYDRFTIAILNFLSRSFEFIRRHIYKD